MSSPRSDEERNSGPTVLEKIRIGNPIVGLKPEEKLVSFFKSGFEN